MPALRVFDKQTTRIQALDMGAAHEIEPIANAALIDLLATATLSSSESRADARMSTARRMVFTDALWAD